MERCDNVVHLFDRMAMEDTEYQKYLEEMKQKQIAKQQKERKEKSK